MDAAQNLFQNTQALDGLATGAKAFGQIAQGNAESKQAEYQAKQLEANAKAHQAKASRTAEEERRRGDVILSNARAAMAGNGGSTTDAGAIQTLAEIQSTTDFNSLSALYDGDTQADSNIQAAQGKRYEGGLARTSGYSAGLSTILKKYNKNKAR